jgi:hypothetical protein
MQSTTMAQAKESVSDETIWHKALDNSFVLPPRQWIFNDNDLSFGNDLYHVDDATLYELALLDIHSQHWEVKSPEDLRRYHRSLQYEVEVYFQSHKAKEVYRTPPFLHSWLIRVMLRRNHDKEGKEQMSKTLNNMSENERNRLELGNLRSDGIISNRMPHRDI